MVGHLLRVEDRARGKDGVFVRSREYGEGDGTA